MSPELRQTALYFSSVLVGQILSFLLLPIVTRFVSAAEYGEYALATAVSGLVAMFGSAWIRNVGMRFYYEAMSRRESKSFYVTTTVLQAGLFALIYVACILVVGYLEIAPLSPSVWISAGVAMMASDLFNYTTSLLRAEQRVYSFAAAEIGSGVLRFAATGAGLYLGFRSAELLFNAASIGFLIGSVFAVRALWTKLTGPARLDRGVLREILNTGPRSIPFSLSAWMERLSDRLILQNVLGATAVGIYSVGYTIGERVVSSLVQAVFMMAWPRILQGWTDGGIEGARAAIRSAQWFYAWSTVGPMLFLVAYGADLARMIIGPEYHSAAPMVPVVAVAIWLGGLGSYMNRHFELTKRYGLLSGISLIGATVNIVVTWLLVPLYGIIGAAFGTLANYALNVVVFYFTRDKRLGSLHLPPFLLAGAGSGAGWALSLIPKQDAPLLQMGIFVGFYTLVALAAVRRFQSSENAS